MPNGKHRSQLMLHLAQNVIRARQKAGLTQHQLAKVAALSRATVHLVEAGECDPRLSTVASLATALGVDTLELFDTHHHPES